MSAYHRVIFGMCSYPEPEEPVGFFYGKSAAGQSHADRAVFADLLELQRGMIRIGFEKLKILVGQLLN